MATTKPKGSGLGGITRKKRTPDTTTPPAESAPAPTPAASVVKRSAPAPKKATTKTNASKRSAGSETKVTLPLDAERHQTLRRLAFEHETTHRAILLALLDIAGDGNEMATILGQAIGERTADRRLEKPRGPAPQSKSY